MKPRDTIAGPALAAPVTITIPPIALPSVTVQASPPALITRRNADHLGMTADEVLRVLRAMRADPRFREAVIVHGKSYRAAPPDAIIAYLRAAPMTAAKDCDEGGDDLLRELGYERVDAARGAR